MDEKYYFIISQKSIMSSEIISFLEKKKVPYKMVPFGKEREEAEKISNQYTPIFIGNRGIGCEGFLYPYYNEIESPLFKTYQLFGALEKLEDWHYQIMSFCKGILEYTWDANLRLLIQMGYSKKEIQDLQNKNRESMEFPEMMEKAAQNAVENSLVGSDKSLLVINWDIEECLFSFEKWLPVLDRVFWLQTNINVLIFTPKQGFYYGYRDIAMELMKSSGYTSMTLSGRSLTYLGSLDRLKKYQIEQDIRSLIKKKIKQGLIY